ncbi:anaerobic ribonucleoside-triphosphate reductase activating protein [Aliarcobacter cryaerophilus]|uniref:anaerobic ribonucleoside-triphosphate reductase activating protein n=1 Tax=Aliarcobacter cryaerophilus TaxID=28198 RepID=UPI000A6EB5E2|nr:anaerobic ribonucleoside-triphosphate reductase activating protein [Aliarcobacter cryaerophilus]
MNINKELNLLNKKIVYSFTKFTTIDYQDEISCIVWHISCNLLCSYCYNDNIVFSKQGYYSHNDILDFLKSRVGLLSAVVLSGGEATMHNLEPFCKEVKKLGFKIKLDTNGINTKIIKELISKNLIDFISLDFKAPKEKFKILTQKSSYEKFYETLKYLIDIKFSFELRTTINGSLLNENDINSMIKIAYNLGYKNSFYIQNYLQTISNIGNIKYTKQINKNLIFKNLLNIEFRN